MQLGPLPTTPAAQRQTDFDRETKVEIGHVPVATTQIAPNVSE
jgi:hypothetical protein